MKKTGIFAVLFIAALLAVGVVSALTTTTDPQENIITVESAGPGTLQSSDGQIFNVQFHTVGEPTTGSISTANEKEVTVENAGKDLIKIGSDTYKLNYVIHTESQKSDSGSIVPGDSDVWGPYSWTAGTSVSVSATWTPTNQDVYLGILDLAQGQGRAALRSGGAGTYSTSVPWSSNEWGKLIINPTGNTATVYYTIS